MTHTMNPANTTCQNTLTVGVIGGCNVSLSGQFDKYIYNRV